MALPPEDPTVRTAVLDRLDGLRTGLVAVGLIAVVALGVAAWTFVRQGDDQGSGGTGAGRSADVRALRNRVEDLDAKLADAASKTDVTAVQKAQDDLAAQVDDLQKAATSATDTEARDGVNQLNENVSALNDSVQDLDARVQALEESQTP